MLGIIIVLLAMSCLAAAAYKIGGIHASPDDPQKAEEKQQQYNTSLVVVALAFMMALCGLLMAASGWNPFNSIASPARGGSSSAAASLGLL